MRKTIGLLFLLAVVCNLISAQELIGEAADNTYPGTSKIRLAENNKPPKFVEFATDVRLSPDEAIDWIQQHFKLSAKTSFELIRVSEDNRGGSHHRFQQLENGHPVIGGIYILHSYNGFVQSMNGTVFPVESSNVSAAISSQEAIDKALTHLPATKYGWQTKHGGGIDRSLSEYPDPKLVWVPENLDVKNGTFRLAYEMDVYALAPHHHRSWVYVDAQTGKVVAEENRICHTNIEGVGATAYSGEQSMWMDQTGPDNVRLRETFHGNGIITLDQQNLDQSETENAVDFTHPDTEWTTGTPIYDRYGTEVHWATQKYHELLDSFFNRNSLNEEGLELISYVHVENNWANATWNGSFARFGDGTPGSSIDRPLGTIDIVAHEFTHGLTDYTANLIYAYESGALNESFSDLFGFANSAFARPESFTWLNGADATSSGLGLRSAEDPNFHGDPDTYKGDLWHNASSDNGGVHTNSGVQNHWYYLLSEGGEGVNDHGDAFVVESIGWRKAIAIAYHNLAFYLTPFSDYDDAMYFGNQSAVDLFGPCSPEYFATVNAWYAVGLGEPATATTLDFQAQRFHCQAPDTVTFFNLSQPVQTVSWDFGDGNFSTENTPTHVYTEPGTYDVTLIAESCGGMMDTIVKEDYIVIDPDALFCTAYTMDIAAVDTLTACSGIVLDPGGLSDYPNNANSVLVIDPPTLGPVILTFTEFRLRSGGGDQLTIYDGTSIDAPLIGSYTNTQLNNQTIQSTGGAVTLEFITNADDIATGYEIYYAVSEAVDVPVAGFDINTIAPLLNAPVQLTDASAYPGEYTYSFGDGSFSNEASPVHQYTAPGSYTITQIIINCLGADTTSSQVVVSEPGSLNLAPDSICVTINAGSQYQAEIVFGNGGPGDLYYGVSADGAPSWLVLDDEAGALANAESATFSFELDATGLIADTFLYVIPMQSGDTSQLNIDFPVKMIVLPFPQASFTSELVDICNGTYQFTDETINEPTSWLWDFGDGSSSTEENPEYQYPEDGVYEVSLATCNDLGCDTVSQEELIIINYCDTLTMDLTGSALMTNCHGLLFDDGGPDGNYSNNVDYTTTIAPIGADFVKLTLNFFQIQPFFDFVYIYDGTDTLAPLLEGFSGFGAPGTEILSTGGVITLRFATNHVATFKGFEIAWECGENLLPPTDAIFAAEEDDDCSNAWYFLGMPDGDYQYTWDFGDGFVYSGPEQSVYHAYTSPGQYTVTLDVSNAVGNSLFSQEVSIASIPFNLDMTVSADTISLNEVITAQFEADITPVEVTWFISTGDTLHTQDLSFLFTEPGNETIFLEIIGPDGCIMWVQKEIYIRTIVGINELAADEVILISPNPSNGQFNLNVKLNEANELGITLYNVLGQRVYQETLGFAETLNHDLELTHLSGGVYVLSLRSKDRILAVRRIVIQ